MCRLGADFAEIRRMARVASYLDWLVAGKLNFETAAYTAIGTIGFFLAMIACFHQDGSVPPAAPI
jgi:hypothetical protein